MKIVKPSVKLLWITENPEYQIEVAGRTCYKSEDRITGDSSAKFAKHMTDVGHHAMIEHACASFKIVTDRGISHEIVRHRIASFAQECVVGSTKLKTGTGSKTITVKELYDKYNSSVCYDKTHFKTLNIKSVDENNNIVNNKVVSVFNKGKQPVFRVKTNLGYQITCTENHKFLNSVGEYVQLKNLNVGDVVMVNGRPSLIKLSDYDFADLYENKGFTPQEISAICGVSYSSVLNKLKKLNIFISHKNDKNKEKYNKNHTQESYEKSKEKIKLQYENGRTAWNKGLSEFDNESVKRQADALRKNHHNNAAGELNSNWRGGISRGVGYRQVERDKCELCNSFDNVEMHHVDGDHQNNNIENLICVCSSCHHKLHFGWCVGKKVHDDQIVSIECVGIEDTYDLEMESPFNNYIADGFVTHNSSRYCNYSKDKFDNQCSFIMPPDLEGYAYELWYNACEEAEKKYFEMLNYVKPEIARSVLPTCTKTEIVMTANFREFRHFIKLRSSKAAHPQIRPLAKEICNILCEHSPSVFADLKMELKNV